MLRGSTYELAPDPAPAASRVGGGAPRPRPASGGGRHPENIGDPRTLRAVIDALASPVDRMPVLFPMHPGTRQAAQRADCKDVPSRILVIDPVGSREFLPPAAHAAVLVSDCGGVAEEVTVLKRPLLVVRSSAERAETMEQGGHGRRCRAWDAAETGKHPVVQRGPTPCPRPPSVPARSSALRRRPVVTTASSFRAASWGPG
ncbi:UDP-N-acetylglucosamine 2-epimerase [Streptomyces tubercidicus]|uniref:UDP-N-acetylglucosamine 2-epimerase n=1 Tax=Streptomyces tubercidicus TaxID=47759 RepID=UPI00346597B8